jgi:hydrogenase maturation factor
MLGIVALLLVLGGAISLAGVAMDAPPVQFFLMQKVTSHPLGSLAPGYASTIGGYRVYSGLVRAFGLTLAGLWAASIFPAGALLAVLGVAFFIFNSVRAIRGEVRTYRALKR